MAEAERSVLADEIRILERELDSKRERLRLLESSGESKPILDRSPKEWIRWADGLSSKIGHISTGGDAAVDVRRMRDRR